MKNRLLWRLGIAFLSGAIVTGLCWYLEILGSSKDYIVYPQTSTRRRLEQAEKAISIYQSKTGHWPVSLARIGDVKETGYDANNARYWPDSWGHQFVYTVKGNQYRLLSYGRDGKLGGVGLDGDLSNDDLFPSIAEVPAWQILSSPMVRRMQIFSTICGLLVALGTFFSLPSEWLIQRNVPWLLLELTAVLIAALYISMFITAVHVPSGH